MKYWLQQIFWILFFWGLGQIVSIFTGGYCPGSVIGMLLLFFALLSGVVRKESVEGVCRLLQKYMAMFFLCLVVGIIGVYDAVASNIVPWTAAIVLSSLAVMAVVGLLAQYMGKRWKK